jgi:hypothetical protein
MGRANAARSEDIIKVRTQGIERGDNGVFLVRHDAHFLEIDTHSGQQIGKMPDVLVLGAPGEKFVANGEHCSPDGLLRSVGHAQTPFQFGDS